MTEFELIKKYKDTPTCLEVSYHPRLLETSNRSVQYWIKIEKIEVEDYEEELVNIWFYHPYTHILGCIFLNVEMLKHNKYTNLIRLSKNYLRTQKLKNL